MKTDCQFINALEDTIRSHGAMDKLVSDRLKCHGDQQQGTGHPPGLRDRLLAK